MEVLNTDPRQLSPLNLAFIGDCVYEMQVRCHLVALANRPVNDLHRESVKFVSAKAQTAAFARMEPLLTEEELPYIAAMAEQVKAFATRVGYEAEAVSAEAVDPETGEILPPLA